MQDYQDFVSGSLKEDRLQEITDNLDKQLKAEVGTLDNLLYHTELYQPILCRRCRSRSEQAPRSEFHPRDESEKKDCGFLGPSRCNKKVNPETYVQFGSYELLLSNVAHQMKEK